MDPALARTLRAIDAAVADLERLSGPVPLDEDYLEAVERIERLPENQSGADKTWVWQAVESARLHFSRAHRG